MRLRQGANMIRSLVRIVMAGGYSALLGLWTSTPALAAQQVEVTQELARLAETHGFAVIGLERTEGSFAGVEEDNLYARLRRLLEGFDHVIVQGPAGGVERVIVLGVKVPFVPPPPAPPAPAEDSDIVVPTQRRGTQHIVRATLEGKNGSKIESELQVDTGADYLVLPLSLVKRLGVDKGSLQEREMQTANGKVSAHIGTLPFLWLGERRIGDVETAFLEDAKLGNSGLLGMSVLSRYKLTIEDDKNRITLGSKEENETAEEGDGTELASGNTPDKNKSP
jgi:aspartyl protease family protein